MILGRVRVGAILLRETNVTFRSEKHTSFQAYDVAAIKPGAPCESIAPIAQFTLPFDCKVKRAAWGPLNDSIIADCIYLACDPRI